MNHHYKPQRATRYRRSYRENEIIEDKVQRLLEEKLIKKTTSNLILSVVLVRKKDGTIRSCVDYRKLYLGTILQEYPIPHVNKCTDALNNSYFFSSFDCNSGFHQIEVKEEDQQKTALSQNLEYKNGLRCPLDLLMLLLRPKKS